MTLSELMLSATSSILIPLPNAIDNHQFYNAKILADNNVGILIKQKDFTIELLEGILLNINKNQIKQMSRNALKIAKPNEVKQIVDYLLVSD